MRLALRFLLLALGGAAFGWFVYEAGPLEILAELGALGPGALLIPLPYVLVYLLDTVGWRFAFRREGERVLGFGALAAIRLAGESVNNVIPSAYVGGEPVKVYLAAKRGAPAAAVASSVVIAKFAMTVAQVVFTLLGALAASLALSGERGLGWPLLVVALGGVLVVLILVVVQEVGIFRSVAWLLEKLRLRPGALAARKDALLALDRTIRSFYREERGRFAASCLWHLLGWMAGVLEVLLIMRLIGEPVSFAQALAIESFTHVAKAAGFVVPGSLGVQEWGVGVAFLGLGLPPAPGATYAILRRAREVLFAVAGGLLLFDRRPAADLLARSPESVTKP